MNSEVLVSTWHSCSFNVQVYKRCIRPSLGRSPDKIPISCILNKQEFHLGFWTGTEECEPPGEIRHYLAKCYIVVPSCLFFSTHSLDHPPWPTNPAHNQLSSISMKEQEVKDNLVCLKKKLILWTSLHLFLQYLLLLIYLIGLRSWGPWAQ